MENQRAKLLLGLGVGFVGVIITWLVYKKLNSSSSSKSRKSSGTLGSKPVPPAGNGAAQSKPRSTNLNDIDLEELSHAQPLAYSSESNLPSIGKNEPPTNGLVDQTFQEEDSVELAQSLNEGASYPTMIAVEETVLPSSFAYQSSEPVNLDETVTLNSSDLDSDLDQSVTSAVDNGDIIVMNVAPTQAATFNTIDFNSSSENPVIEVITIEEDSVSIDCVQDEPQAVQATVVAQPEPSSSLEQVVNELEEISDLLKKSHATEQEQAQEPVTDVMSSESAERVSAALDELSDSLGTVNPLHEQTAERSCKNAIEANADDQVNRSVSEVSDDSVNDVTSLATDSGIGLTSTHSSVTNSQAENCNRTKDGNTSSNDRIKQADTNKSAAAVIETHTNGSYADAVTSTTKNLVAEEVSYSSSKGSDLTVQDESMESDLKLKSSDDLSVNSSENGNLSIESKPSSPQTMEAHMSTAADDTDAGVSNGHQQQLQNGAAEMGASGDDRRVVYKFLMPVKLCGLFIGKAGRNISHLKQKTNTNIKIGKEPVLYNFRYCTIEGSEQSVEKALRLIKKQYPKIDTTRVDELGMPGNLTLSPDRMQLHLPMGVLVDCTISQVVSAGHVFVQQPTHPSFTSWQRMSDIMNACYADGSTVPQLPEGTEDGVLCVALVNGLWCRAHIMAFSPDRKQCEIKLVDVGGYTSVDTAALRQIRQDFLTLPFQAVECYLANIEPLDKNTFSPEADAALSQMTLGQMVQCQPAAVAENNIPYIHVIANRGTQAFVVNRELANLGLVNWYNLTDA